MKDISVTCDCGKPMIKIEDGRLQSTLFHNPHYPKFCMEFVCPCGKAVDVSWGESLLQEYPETQSHDICYGCSDFSVKCFTYPCEKIRS